MTNKLLSFVLTVLISMVTSVVYADEHEYVDLGLPSGTLWATCNVGANSPEEFGDYIAWGETIGSMNGKTIFDWSTYKYCNGSEKTLTKYCNDSSYGYDGFKDELTELLLVDDAACSNWGSDWCTPSETQFAELINTSYTTTEWTTLNGVKGCIITGKSNGNSIFLPAAGVRSASSCYNVGEYGCFMSRSLGTGYVPGYATTMAVRSSGLGLEKDGRCNGKSLRPVRRKNIDKHEYVDLGLPSGTLWATCNVGANSPEEYGDYFAWGETTPKDTYKWNNYKWGNGSMTKYCCSSSFGTVDNKSVLEYVDDAAYVNWSANWRMPTKDEMDELINMCTWVWTEQNGVNGYSIKGANGNTIFLPAARCKNDEGKADESSFCSYWSSSIHPSTYNKGMSMLVKQNARDQIDQIVLGVDRFLGLTIRPVYLIPTISITLNHENYTLDGVGKNVQLVATILPENASNKEIIWKSYNESVCIVNNGLVIATGYGSTIVTATTVEGGYMAYCTITVTDNTPVRDIDPETSGYKVYDLQGRECKRLQKGINIIRFKDGTSKKVLVK